MGTYCDCCSTDAQFVQDHLNYDPYGPGLRPERWGNRRWREHASECIEFWADRDPLPNELDADTLAELMRSVYST